MCGSFLALKSVLPQLSLRSRLVEAMASTIALEKAVIGSVSYPSSSSASPSSTKPLSLRQRLIPADCCSRRHRARIAQMRAVMSGSKFRSAGDFSRVPSSSCLSDELGGLSGGYEVHRFLRNGDSIQTKGRGRLRGGGIVTMALPSDTYWITAAQAVAVAGLMAGSAVLAGILINIRVEIEALAEFKELEGKGLLPEDMTIPERENWKLDSPLYIFPKKELSSAKAPSRNRPVREEFEPQMETETRPELETASKE